LSGNRVHHELVVGPGGNQFANMKQATKLYLGLMLAAAILVVGIMYWASPTYDSNEIKALAFLAVVAIASEMMSFSLAREGRGSIAYIPYFASVVLVPSWLAVVCVALIKLLMELLSRIDLRKALFNSAVHVLMLGSAIGLYRGLGGRSILGHEMGSLTAMANDVGLAAIIAFTVAFVLNVFLVTGVLALDSGESFRGLLRSNLLAAIGGDLIATPVIFVFAWVYASFGPMIAAVAWIPFLSLRHVSRLNIELQRTNEELLQLMVKSIEARDPYTSGHSRRVSKYAVAIARMLGKTEKEIKDIETAALLHDVGKIYEKYGPILSSTQRLSAAEWAVMQEHPADGANLVNTITRMRHLVPAVRHHHENWDGTGYPDRKAGSEIPLASRIIMFADTIDAMTSERPYRRSLTEADVCSELLRCRGKQFDPEIADRLLTVGVWKTLFGEAKSRGNQKLELVEARSA
jgi:putative nucleotidyltransferase with HDIG domain